MLLEPLPSLFDCVLTKPLIGDAWRDASSEHRANHVLVNRYDADDGGIMPHTDGPLYAPRVCIVSLGASCRFDFSAIVQSTEYGDGVSMPKLSRVRQASLVVRPRSLLVFEGDAYSRLLHSISDERQWPVDELVVNAAAANVAVGSTLQRDDVRRVSLTIRVVKRTWRAVGVE